MEIDQVLHQRKSDAEPGARCSYFAFLLLEYLEYVGQEFGCNAYSRVPDFHYGALCLTRERHADTAALRRELHSVRKHVGKDLLQPDSVSFYQGRLGCPVKFNHDALRFCVEPSAFQRWE